jgi:hypothetical protein
MACRKGVVYHFTCGDTFELGSDKSWPLTWFYVKEFHNFKNIVAVFNAQTLSDV